MTNWVGLNLSAMFFHFLYSFYLSFFSCVGWGLILKMIIRSNNCHHFILALKKKEKKKRVPLICHHFILNNSKCTALSPQNIYRYCCGIICVVQFYYFLGSFFTKNCHITLLYKSVN